VGTAGARAGGVTAAGVTAAGTTATAGAKAETCGTKQA